MKIVFASSSFGGGGITSYAHEVINNFSQGNDFSVIIGDDTVSPIKVKNVKVYKYECSDLSVANARKILDLINNELKPDVLIGNFADIIPVIAPYLLDTIKLLTVSHSLKYEASDIAGVAHRYIDTIIAASSSYNKKYLEDRFHITDKNKVKIIYNFVSDIPDADKIRKAKMDQDPIAIVYPGGSSGSKSPDIVVQVLLKLLKTNAPFKFYWMKDKGIAFSKYTKFFGLSSVSDITGVNDSRLVFPGRLPTREDAVNLISHANILLFPSRREGCPMALLEGLRVGTIPIVSDFGNANKEIVNDRNNGFIISHQDIDGFAERIIDIINNHNKYSYIYENSREYYKQNLSFSVWKKKMETVIYDSSSNHIKRKSLPSSLAILYNIVKIKLLIRRCIVERYFQEILPVFFTMLRLRFINR